MKKRILMILTLGVTFAPAVFAAGPTNRVETGEMNHNNLAPQSVACDSKVDKANSSSESVGSKSNGKSVSGVAR